MGQPTDNAGGMRAKYTVAEVAQMWGVDPKMVLRWIKLGELPAVNVATRADGGKPRWRIDKDALAEFERKRASRPAIPPVKTERRPRFKGKDYFQGGAGSARV